MNAHGQNKTDEVVRLDTLSARDKTNPFIIAQALEGSLHQSQKQSILYFQFPGMALGLVGMAMASPVVIFAAAGLLGLRAYNGRMNTTPQLSTAFNDAATGITEPRPRAELDKLGSLLATDRQSPQSWLQELNPRKHYLRTPAIGALVTWGLISANPTMIPLAAFVMAASLLDQQGDFFQSIRKQTTETRHNLRAWRTGLHFGR
jgi:hypothetical protein